MAKKNKQTPAATERVKYAFPTVSACPRCRSTDTQATSTQGRIQYRICRRAVCRRRYAVIGVAVKKTGRDNGITTDGKNKTGQS